uniref:Uncharacterized protein n=1 Tax=uncultured Rhodospirillales bacterium HF4000_38H21 TaxID=723612 RepID=E7C8H0_9PROT|nr:hypothetical protein [uncultured Rhodospirillales bacterium HF4000_38H21]
MRRIPFYLVAGRGLALPLVAQLRPLAFAKNLANRLGLFAGSISVIPEAKQKGTRLEADPFLFGCGERI